MTKDPHLLPEEIVEIEGKPKPTSEFLDDYYRTLGDGTLELLGIKTGFEQLNKATLGLDGLIVLGGIAGAGKTSLALQLAFDASDTGTPTLFYSLEMPRRAVLTKILSRLANVRYSDILLKGRRYLSNIPQDYKLGYKLSDGDASRLTGSKDALKSTSEKFYLRTRERDETDINFDTVEREINFIKASHKAERILVVIDHLQVFNAGKDYRPTDQIDKENILITGFKGISERTGATIILISQKNKAGFTSSGLQTIKGSVDIVYLADVVMFLDTPQERKKREKLRAGTKASWQDIDQDEDDIITHYGNDPRKDIDLLIEKNRYNAPTAIKMKFNGEYSEFTEATPE
jgi:replicative DNA helicase